MIPPKRCPFCGAPQTPHDVWTKFTCGTSNGAKGHQSLWFQTIQCKENAKAKS